MTTLGAGQLAAQILAVGAAVDAAETLSRRADYVLGGIYDWSLVRTGRVWSARGYLASLLDSLFRPRIYEALVVSQMLLAAGLFIVSWGKEWQAATAALLISLFVLRILTHVRHSYGLDGSDQMSVIVLAALVLAFISPTQFGKTVAIYFIAFQSFLAYLSSGIAKMTSPIWRSGKALPAILNTQSYGSRYASGTLKAMPRAALLACWAVMIFQVTFPALALASVQTCTIALIAGLFFHIGIAVFMGLNNFVWSFPACYPAVWKIATDLHAAAAF